MRLQKWFIPFGMIGVFSFFTHTVLGNILWQGYNPIRQTISELTADGSPNAQLLRVFVCIYEVCLLIFALGMIYTAFRKHNGYIKTGYSLLLFTALISIVGFNAFPMSVAFILSPQNLAHIIVTIILLCSTILSVILISIGYLKKENTKALGRVSLYTAIIPAVFSLIIWYAVLQGYQNIGLLERISVYPFHVFTFMVSWHYTRLLNIDEFRMKVVQ